MDFDISESPDGVPQNYRNSKYYDKDFLKFTQEEFQSIDRYGFTNISNYSTEETLEKGLKTSNLSMILLYLSDMIIFGKDKLSDGIVPLDSQKYIEQIYRGKNLIARTFTGGSHEIGSDEEMIHNVLNTILEKHQDVQENIGDEKKGRLSFKENRHFL